MCTRPTSVAISLLICVTASIGYAGPIVWWEGEQPRETNFPAKGAFDPAGYGEKRDQLSGGDWLNIGGPRRGEAAFANYTINVPADANYHFWARKFWKHGPFDWRFDDSPWQSCDKDVVLADTVDLATHICANWVSLGRVQLTAGQHTFSIRLQAKPGADQAAAFDCFVLSADTFIPNGKLKPGEKIGLADDGFFPWEPAADPFKADAKLDLRYLNESEAGATGFLRRDGKNIVRGDGKAIRFWAVNIGIDNCRQDRASIDYLARKLAKLGVNMVRIHGPLSPNLSRPDAFRAADLDGVHYTVAALKKEGIYVSLSFYFPIWWDVADDWGISGYDAIKNRKPFALVFFQPRFQQMYRDYLQRILTAPNPYTGNTLAEDPSVGLVELVNEDSLFFWTFAKGNIPPKQWSILQGQFSSWVKKQHGSHEKALAAWSGTRMNGDTATELELLEAWAMTSDGIRGKSPGHMARLADQVRFLAETQRGFYETTAKFLRDECKVGGMICAGNWTVSDFSLLDAIERWTYTAGDVIDTHGYFEANHKGDGAGYSVRVGHTYTDSAAVKDPRRVPLRFNQVADFPQIISELGFTNPNRFRADGMFLTAATASVQGVDGVYFFKADSNYLVDAPMAKFSLGSPAVSGMFPALALMYRRGDIAEREPAMTQSLATKDLFSLKGSKTFTGMLDSKTRGGRVSDFIFHPLTAYLGPLVREFDGPKEKPSPTCVDANDWIDDSAKLLRTPNDEIQWSFGSGHLGILTRRFSGVSGFLSPVKDFASTEFTVFPNNDYLSAMLVSLDDEPILTSKKLLIQVMTEERPRGFRSNNGKIESIGTAPIGVKKIAGSVRFPRGEWRVSSLDENGYAKETLPLSGGEMQLQSDVMYYILER